MLEEWFSLDSDQIGLKEFNSDYNGKYDCEFKSLEDCPGAHSIFKETPSIVIDRIKQRVPEKVEFEFNSMVESIVENDNSVDVHTINGETHTAKWIINTIPLGGLKYLQETRPQWISPALPESVEKGIKGVQMTSYNKLIFVVTEEMAKTIPTWLYFDHEHFFTGFCFYPSLGKPIIKLVCHDKDAQERPLEELKEIGMKL